MGKLSSAVVQRKLASLRDVEEALARQVLYGGDFVTNLLEQVVSIDEAALAFLDGAARRSLPIVTVAHEWAGIPFELGRNDVQNVASVESPVLSVKSARMTFGCSLSRPLATRVPTGPMPVTRITMYTPTATARPLKASTPPVTSIR